MHLSVSRLSKSYGPEAILNDISFVVPEGERVGLVGANGSGKSTLLRILAGDIAMDSGNVSIPDGVSIGYLPQDPPDAPGLTIEQLILAGAGNVRDVERRLRELEEQMTSAEPALLDSVMSEYGELQDRFERAGGYDIEHRIDQVREGLGITGLGHDRDFTSLSGGEKARVQLAALLLMAPDVLLLDEPTNHLDFASIQWLEGFLAAHAGILIAVSHDREFLNRTVTRILEVDEHTHQVHDYAGNYDSYAIEQGRQRKQWEERFDEQQEEMKELRRAIRQARAGVDRKAPPPRDPDKNIAEAAKARADKTSGKSIRWLEERLRRLEADPVPRPPAMLRMSPRLDSDDMHSDEVVRFDNVNVAFDGLPILHNISLTLRRTDRVTLVGPNGSGKSTLLNLIAGRIQPDSGTVFVSPAARIGYLDQHGADFEPERSVFDTWRQGLNGPEHQLVSDLVRFGLLNYDDLAKPVGGLSAGQRRKLQIAQLAAGRFNLLLLDEPTNHLSLNVLEDFERALAIFSGPMLTASHDRYYIERFGGTVWELADGRLIQHHGKAEEALCVVLQQSNIDATGHIE